MARGAAAERGSGGPVSPLTRTLVAGVVGLSTVLGCSRHSAPPPRRVGLPASDAAAGLRPTSDVAAAGLGDPNPEVRQRAARALARSPAPEHAALLRLLEDVDDQTVAWAAFGLGRSCDRQRDATVSALAARLASLDPVRIPATVDGGSAIVRALGRCGGNGAERTLVAELASRAAAAGQREAAAYALGDIASDREAVSAATATALLDDAEALSPIDAALYPFGFAHDAADTRTAARVVAAARAALGRSGYARLFAVRALGRTDRSDAARDLARLLSSGAFEGPERVEAATALGRMRDPGQGLLAAALSSALPDDARALAGGLFAVLLSIVTGIDQDASTSARPVLWRTARLNAGTAPSRAVSRRASRLRCEAAARLARAASNADVLRACDVGDGESGALARLAALDRGELTGARRDAWVGLARDPGRPGVRAAAIETIPRHPELGDVVRGALADGLSDDQAVLVAAAADVLRASPESAFTADHHLEPHLAAALQRAMTRPWGLDHVGARIALLDAARATGSPDGAFFLRACHDANEAVRSHAAAALYAIGQPAACARADAAPADAFLETDHPLTARTRVELQTEGGTVGITFDPSLAPVAAARLVGLARRGLYDGSTIRRSPQLVVRLAVGGRDERPESAAPLPCEDSPVAFGPLDVGVGLSGPDTAPTEIFVTLVARPDLDGRRTRVGVADGDWSALADGDTIQRVRVAE